MNKIMFYTVTVIYFVIILYIDKELQNNTKNIESFWDNLVLFCSMLTFNITAMVIFRLLIRPPHIKTQQEILREELKGKDD